MVAIRDKDDKVVFHCTRCCGPDIIEHVGCLCNEMKDGIVTVFGKEGKRNWNGKGKNPHWVCRECSRKFCEERLSA